MMYEGYDEERIGIAPEWVYKGYRRQLEHIEKLEALLDSAYPFVAGHNWRECDCPRCLWVHAYNELMGGERTTHSPHLDNVPATKQEGSHGWKLKGLDGAYDWATDDPDWDGG